VPRTLRHIDVRCGSNPKRQHLTLVFRATDPPSFPLDSLRKSCPAVDGISINLNPTKGPQVIRGSVQPVWGGREIWVDHAGFRLRVSPAAFFQVNLALLPAIHQRLEKFFDRGEVLADLYAGVGTHGLALSHRFRRVLFAEGNRSAIADLKSTIRGKGGNNFRISAVAVERGLDQLLGEKPDAVILNPSRAGAVPKVLVAVARCPTTKLAYLSCDPETLCRDLDVLCGLGFRVRSIQPIDMMPQTRQVEALALLTR
jgi:23S rRNA (uracil1939-C5)-methyltransferase